MILNRFFKDIFFIISIFYSTAVFSVEGIFYIDMDYLMNNSIAGKLIIKQIDEKNQSNIAKFKKIHDDFTKEKVKIISQKNVLNDDEYKKSVELFSNKIKIYETEKNKAINDLSKMRIDAQKILVRELTPILSNYAEQKSISYIIPKQNIIIGKSELDLTNTILEILNIKLKSINLE